MVWVRKATLEPGGARDDVFSLRNEERFRTPESLKPQGRRSCQLLSWTWILFFWWLFILYRGMHHHKTHHLGEYEYLFTLSKHPKSKSKGAVSCWRMCLSYSCRIHGIGIFTYICISMYILYDDCLWQILVDVERVRMSWLVCASVC